MKRIVLCDRGLYKDSAHISHKYGVGINCDTFSDTDKFQVYHDEIIKMRENYLNEDVVSLHAPYRDLCLGSRDDEIRKVTMDRFNSIYDISRLLNCNHIVLHHGYIPGTSLQEKWVQRAKNFFLEFLEEKKSNVFFYIENQFERTPEIMEKVISSVDSKNLKICLDIGHANCNSDIEPLEWIWYLREKIGFVHMHNNFGKTDQHLGLRDGQVLYERICSALEKYAPDSIWAIETNSLEDAEDSIQWLLEKHYLQSI